MGTVGFVDRVLHGAGPAVTTMSSRLSILMRRGRLVIVDQHHAERRLLHGSDANPRRRGRPRTASTGLEDDHVAESIEKSLRVASATR
jgi:hypothetical protein